MKPTKVLALVFLALAFVVTGMGGLLDIVKHKGRITRRHMWNDGMFLAVVAIALLLL